MVFSQYFHCLISSGIIFFFVWRISLSFHLVQIYWKQAFFFSFLSDFFLCI